MALYFQSALRRSLNLGLRELSTAAEAARKPIPDDNFQIFRTLENDPLKHTSDHLRRFYTVPENHRLTVLPSLSVTKEWRDQIKTFAELSLIVRQPAVEIISYLRQTDFNKPVNRFLIYGVFGAGKTSTMMHLLHYAYAAQFLLVHVPWCPYWFIYPKEVANSTTKEGLLNLPIDSALWLSHFKHQNGDKLKNLKLAKSYEWSARETTEAGASFLELVELGINRVRYATDIVLALMEEIKIASNAGHCRTLVMIDGFNAFLGDATNVKNDFHKKVSADKVVLTEAFLNITKYDWKNGAVIVSVDTRAEKEHRESHLPLYLLGKVGFKHLDPFIPVCVENFDNEEYEAFIEYYKSKKWISDISPEAMKELQLISNSNGGFLVEYCKAL